MDGPSTGDRGAPVVIRIDRPAPLLYPRIVTRRATPRTNDPSEAIMIDPITSLLGVALVLATPGPTNALLASAGVTTIGRLPWGLIAAELLGYGLAITALRLVGTPAIAALPALAPALRLMLALYLLFLGCCLWRHDVTVGTDAPITPGRVFVTTLLNPKAAIFAFALFPEDRAGLALLPWALGFAAVVVTCATAWFFVGERARHFGGAPAGNLLPRFASVVLVGFAVFVATTTLATIA